VKEKFKLCLLLAFCLFVLILGAEDRDSAPKHGVTYHNIFLVSWGGVRLSPLGTSATNWPTVSVPDECGVVGGKRIFRGNRSTRSKPA
jgi:hypothetical protein